MKDPEWDFDDIVAYLQSPTRTWDGVVYSASIDGDCHHFNYRSDVFDASAELAEQWTADGGEGEWGPPATWQQVQQYSEFPLRQGTGRRGHVWHPRCACPRRWRWFVLLL
ncbi:MAG: hypothetical protein M9947_11880 [Thermomicrobiales bacterium]|nr:hypothetical protein [Thermomicrobiales bacterium]